MKASPRARGMEAKYYDGLSVARDDSSRGATSARATTRKCAERGLHFVMSIVSKQKDLLKINYQSFSLSFFAGV